MLVTRGVTRTGSLPGDCPVKQSKTLRLLRLKKERGKKKKKKNKDGDNHAGAKLKSKVSYHNFVKDLLPPLRHLFSHACPLAASQPGRETWTDMCLEAAQRDSSLYPEKQKSNGAFVLCPYKNKAIFSEGFVLCRGPMMRRLTFPNLNVMSLLPIHCGPPSLC